MGDLFEDGRLRPEYHTEPIYAWFQKRHSAGTRLIEADGYYRRNGHEWKVPYGVKHALGQPIVHSQFSYRYPYFVTWRSPRTGKRFKKNVVSISAGITFVAEKAQYVDPNACVVSKLGFVIPTKLAGKFPRKGYYWCPRCMAPRKFRRQYHSTGDPMVTYVQRKVWSETKRRYEQLERKVALMRCVVCGISNRDDKFKRSNQPYEKRRIKRGVTRIRRRRRVKSRR